MSDIFSFINTQSLAIVILVLAIWNIVLSYRVFRAERRSDAKTPTSNNSGEIKDTMAGYSKTIEEIKKQIQAMDYYSKENRNIAMKGLQNIGVVRFNPFKDVGGDQSFAIALLDAEGNGLTVSSLYGREGTRIYAKPIKNNASPYQLSGEEKEAVSGAMGKANSQ